MDERLEAIIAKDAELVYCGTCERRVYAGEPDEPHGMTVERCRELRPEGLDCADPSAHHDVKPGPIPEWMEDASDRRYLLELLLPRKGAAGA